MPQVQWFHQNQALRPDSRHNIESRPDGRQVLTIVDSVVADSGDYRIEIFNEVGKTNSAATLTVIPKEVEESPEFSKNLKAQSVPEGQTAVMECVVTGKPEPEIHWYRGREKIAPGGREKVFYKEGREGTKG